jgi:SAM-dependent methyltransferase
MNRPGQSGSGPGVITPDGSAVELYRRLTPQNEPAIVHGSVFPGASILELGCGTGRMTRPLVEFGHPVVVVDESPEMLSCVPERVRGVRIRKFCSTIERLRLDERFDVVLLASYLINLCDSEVRKQILDTCKRHLRENGAVIIQQHSPEHFSKPLIRERENLKFVVRDIVRDSANVGATLEFHVDGAIWMQTVTVEQLGRDRLESCLRDSSLRFDSYLTDDHTWIRAVTDGPA